MKKIILFVCIYLLSFVPVFSQEVPGSKLDGILARIDSYRLPPDSMKYTVAIDVREKEALISHDTFLISSKGDKSLIEMQSAKSQGQKVLVIDQQMWIKMPKSSRVIRITPLQRLTGQASFSDLARLQFREKYTISDAKDVLIGDRKCLGLELKAKQKNETYASVYLVVDSETAYPIKADFFLLSGKKFKSLEFEPPTSVYGKQINTKYKIYDEMVKDQITELTVSNIKLVNIPDYVFAMSYLEGQ